jgi:hypothetical protein
VPRGRKKIKNLKKYPRGGDTWRFCAMLCSQGVSQRIFSMQGGDLKKKYYKGVSQNTPTLQGGNSYLTLNIIWHNHGATKNKYHLTYQGIKTKYHLIDHIHLIQKQQNSESSSRYIQSSWKRGHFCAQGINIIPAISNQP